jgi:hypothetical protein
MNNIPIFNKSKNYILFYHVSSLDLPLIEHYNASDPPTPYKIYINMYLQMYPILDHSGEEFVPLRGVSVNGRA